MSSDPQWGERKKPNWRDVRRPDSDGPNALAASLREDALEAFRSLSADRLEAIDAYITHVLIEREAGDGAILETLEDVEYARKWALWFRFNFLQPRSRALRKGAARRKFGTLLRSLVRKADPHEQ